MRNIDEEILDSLSPQPSIVNTITHGLQNKNSITKSHQEEGTHIIFPYLTLLQNMLFQKKNSEQKQHQRVEPSQQVFKTQKPHSEIGLRHLLN